MSNEKQVQTRGMSGLVFAGFLMIGLAAGFVTRNFAASILGGLGLGFVGMSLAMLLENLRSPQKGAAGVAFVGCLLLGLAVGLFSGNVVIGLFSGLGVGFIAMFIAYFITRQW